MNEPNLIQALLLLSASIDAQAIMVNFADNIALDPEIKDPNVRAMNEMHIQLKKIHYYANLDIVKPESGWPKPAGGSSGVSGEIKEKLQSTIGSIADQALKATLSQLVNQLN